MINLFFLVNKEKNMNFKKKKAYMLQVVLQLGH